MGASAQEAGAQGPPLAYEYFIFSFFVLKRNHGKHCYFKPRGLNQMQAGHLKESHDCQGLF